MTRSEVRTEAYNLGMSAVLFAVAVWLYSGMSL